MILTNTFGLPEPLVRALTWSDRNREGCDYTVTEIISPPRIRALDRLYGDKVVEDVSDRIWFLLGSAGHEVLRRSADKKRIVEERAIAEVDGFKVGGQLDYSEADHAIWDYKFTSIYAAKEGAKDEWIQQLNCYRWLAHQYGVEVEALKIVCIFRDWSKPKAGREEDYPQSQVKVFDLPLWSHDETHDFIKARIWLHERAKKELPLCTSDDMWERPEVWALKKKGNKRAIKLYPDEELALKALAPGLEIEHRPAERPRCQHYCKVSEFCSQFKEFQKQNH